ncbi:MAG: DUF1080 domain-containing protein [Armatimonadota bacterium]
MTRYSFSALVVLLGTAAIAIAAPAPPDQNRLAPLFPGDSLRGWRVGNWNDVARSPGGVEGRWTLKDGELTSAASGTWLYSPEEYGDFVLQLEAKVAPGANGGIAIRFPVEGDPAYRGMEVQVIDADAEIHKSIGPADKTGAVYDELVPAVTARPSGEWNALEITCRGPRLTVLLNGKPAVDADLSKETSKRSRGVPLAERPRRGRLGFQNIDGTVAYRKLLIRRLD